METSKAPLTHSLQSMGPHCDLILLETRWLLGGTRFRTDGCCVQTNKEAK